MRHTKEWSSSYKSADFGKAYLGDDRGQPAIGIGEVKNKVQDGVEQVLRRVKHLPGLQRNLISVGVLYHDGLLFWGEPDGKAMKIMKGDEVVMIGEKMTSILYKFQGCVISGGVTEDGVAETTEFSLGGGSKALDSLDGSQ
jgi:hypothetical protein